ncbi:MAG TPA: outer membrane beta-barrel protein [Puia sp.]|jgi:hypothetical protein|nr:outer membrane beta-barrel protein [Puia sp.]
MRILPAFVLLLSTLCANGQSHWENWHIGGGLAFGTINFSQNGTGGIVVPVDYDFLNTGKSSFSLGTRPKIGTEDENGISFPAYLLLAIGGGSNSGNDDFHMAFFTDLPLLLHYNFGAGTAGGNSDKFGFYAGGGMSYTTTGYTLHGPSQESTNFFGWVVDGGVRFAKGTDLEFSITRPLNNPIGPINNPLFYQITLMGFRVPR